MALKDHLDQSLPLHQWHPMALKDHSALRVQLLLWLLKVLMALKDHLDQSLPLHQ